MSRVRVNSQNAVVLAFFSLKDGAHLRTRIVVPDSRGKIPLKSLHRFKCKDLTMQACWELSRFQAKDRKAIVKQISDYLKEVSLVSATSSPWQPVAGSNRGLVEVAK